MTWNELCKKITAITGIGYNTIFGWRALGFVKKENEYSEEYLTEILAKIPYCQECGKRQPIGTTHLICTKCNKNATVPCEKCGAPVHKYWNEKEVLHPLCHKCALNTTHVIAAVRDAAKKSWETNREMRIAATTAAVQTEEHRQKMQKLSLKAWESPGRKDKIKTIQTAVWQSKWDENGRREYPHATRLSLHVFRCSHCDTVYVDMKLDNSRQPSVNYCPNCQSHFTGPEKIIEKYLRDAGVEYISHWRPEWLSRKELDFYLPKHQLAIEIDGVFYHSEEGGKDKKYHLRKTEKCEENNIHLVHIWDLEIQNKWPIVKDRLDSLLLKNDKKIGARKCEVREIKTKTAKEFLEKNHIQGFTPCNTYCGLYYMNTLIGVAAFHKGRTANPGEWELARYATTLGMHVSGGLSRAVAWFRKSHPNTPLISYADRRWTTCGKNAYMRFTCIRKTEPSYYYAYHRQIYRREKFMLKSLAKNPITAKTYIPGMTEKECCSKISGLFKIWDCGQLLYRII